jgi:hypothetical protein
MTRLGEAPASLWLARVQLDPPFSRVEDARQTVEFQLTDAQAEVVLGDAVDRDRDLVGAEQLRVPLAQLVGSLVVVLARLRVQPQIDPLPCADERDTARGDSQWAARLIRH